MVDNLDNSSEQEKDFFVRIFRQLSANQDPYLSISGILRDTCDFFGFYSGFVYEADETRVFHLREQYSQGEATRDSFILSDYLNDEDIEELVKHSGEIVYLNSRKTRLGAKFLELFSAKTLVMVPVIFEQKKLIAFAGLMDRRHPVRLSKHAIDDADAVLSVLAGHIKIRVYQERLEYALQSMKNNEELIRKLADNDALTGLPNRRKFMADIEESVKRMEQNNSSGYLLFMDLDDFKLINDTLGHLAGDTLLCGIGDFLRGEQENLGITYRYGGDEFIILAENKIPDDLQNIRETLLRRFDAGWELGEHRVPVLCSISIGAALIPQGDTPVEGLIRAADAAMYEVKKSGKHGFREFKQGIDK
ncbi:hypothetical protein FACS189450_12370 [Spirochaetia bacterium]|nr:hypothetical protein FACS189450_12370 [Spirochaetia bacterium]GHU94853.1 hypothetical protein FACS189479_08000 [Spirochaetia bacterium]